MTGSTLLSEIAVWLEGHVLVSTTLAVVGAAALLAILGFAIAGLVRIIRVVFGISRVASNGKVRRAAAIPGYRILIGDIEGPHGATARETLEDALVDNLKDFCFGAQFQVFRVASPSGRAEGLVLEQARRKLKKTGADMLFWGLRLDNSDDGLRLFGVSRGGLLTAEQAVPFTLKLPGRLRRMDPIVARAAIYMLAKRLQPALLRPESFRDEKVAEFGEQIDLILDAAESVDMTKAMTRDLEADFATIVLHLAESSSQNTWIEKLIERRRATLDALKAEADVDSQIDVRLDLGRALIKRAEATFDPVAVREASVHLNAAIESLRLHDVIVKAQRASDSLSKAQSLVETRRRFAVNFSA